MNTFKGMYQFFIWNSRLKIQRSMQYRTDFVVGFLISLIYSSLSPIVQYLIFNQTKGLPGWNINQIILFQGVVLFWLGVRELVFGELKYFVMDLVWKGDFDRLLLKPYPSIGIILSSGFSLNSFGTILAGAVIIGYSISVMSIAVSFLQMILFILSIISAIVLFGAINVLYSGIVIMLINMNRIDAIFSTLLKLGDYPLIIYPKIIQTILLIIVPFAIFAYIPANILLNRFDLKFLFVFICAFALFWLSIKFWNACLKKYTSAGG